MRQLSGAFTTDKAELPGALIKFLSMICKGQTPHSRDESQALVLSTATSGKKAQCRRGSYTTCTLLFPMQGP